MNPPTLHGIQALEHAFIHLSNPKWFKELFISYGNGHKIQVIIYRDRYQYEYYLTSLKINITTIVYNDLFKYT